MLLPSKNYEDNYRSGLNDLNVPYPNHIIHLNILEIMNVQILTKSRINKHCIEGICIVEGKKTEYLLNRYNDSVITEFSSRQEPFFIKFGKDWRNQVNYAIWRALLSFR